ncbi:hypothetical protein Tco_0308853 [Tanacetum coccineum]
MIEKHSHVRDEGCQKVRTVKEDIENLNLKSKGQVWRIKTYPSHGYARRLIRSCLASVISIYQRGSVCLAMSKRMTKVKIQKIIRRQNVEDNHSFPQRRSGSWQSGTEEDISAMEAAGCRTQIKFHERRL